MSEEVIQLSHGSTIPFNVRANSFHESPVSHVLLEEKIVIPAGHETILPGILSFDPVRPIPWHLEIHTTA